MADEEVIAHLTEVKGVGTWTAQMFLMFSLRRPDVLPTGDFGIQTAIRKYYRKRKMPKPAEMEKIAKPWIPYRSVACWYFVEEPGHEDALRSVHHGDTETPRNSLWRDSRGHGNGFLELDLIFLRDSVSPW